MSRSRRIHAIAYADIRQITYVLLTYVFHSGLKPKICHMLTNIHGILAKLRHQKYKRQNVLLLTTPTSCCYTILSTIMLVSFDAFQ